MARITTLVALTLFLHITSIPRAHACSCLPALSPADEMLRCDAVFLGRVVSINANNETMTLYAALVVERRWRGAENDTVEVLTHILGSACGYRFQVGERHLVYAEHRHSVLHVSGCSRTRPFDSAAADIAALDGYRWSSPSIAFYVALSLTHLDNHDLRSGIEPGLSFGDDHGMRSGTGLGVSIDLPLTPRIAVSASALYNELGRDPDPPAADAIPPPYYYESMLGLVNIGVKYRADASLYFTACAGYAWNRLIEPAFYKPTRTTSAYSYFSEQSPNIGAGVGYESAATRHFRPFVALNLIAATRHITPRWSVFLTTGINWHL